MNEEIEYSNEKISFNVWKKILKLVFKRKKNIIVMILSVIGLAIYLWGSLYYKKALTIKGVAFKMPNFKLALEQIFIGSIS